MNNCPWIFGISDDFYMSKDLISSLQSNMVDLFSNGGNHITAIPSLMGDGDHQPQPFDVAETWQKVIGNKWVIGVDVVNRTQRSVFLCPTSFF
jgi:hypothetical protein